MLDRNLLSTLAIVAIAAGQLPCWAQDSLTNPPDSSVGRGLYVGGQYSQGNIESVNVVNGNVGLKIPLAWVGPGPGGMSLGVNLTYNSAIFDVINSPYQTSSGDEVVTLQPSVHGGGWSYGYRYTLWSQSRNTDNALAQISGLCGYYQTYQVWDYFKTFLRTPDGNNHVLRLVSSSPAGSFQNSADTSDSYYTVDFAGKPNTFCNNSVQSFSGTLIYATIDSTYIRVEVNTASRLWIGYLPDGTRIYGSVQMLYGKATDSDATEILDRNGNYVEMVGNCLPGTSCTETLFDNTTAWQSREIQIAYGAQNTQNPAGWQDTINWAGVNGPLQTTINWGMTSPPGGAVYNTVVSVSNGTTSSPTATFAPTPFVNSVQLPATASGGVAMAFQFAYTGTPGTDSAGELHTLTMCTQTSSSCQAQYTVQYTYQNDTLALKPTLALNPIASKTLNYTELDRWAAGGADSQTQLSETTTYSIPTPTSLFTYPAVTGSSNPIRIIDPSGATTSVYTTLLCPSNLQSPAPSRDFCQAVAYKTAYPDGTTREQGWIGNNGTAVDSFPGLPSGAVINPYVQYTATTAAIQTNPPANGAYVIQDLNGNTTSYQEWDWFPSSSATRTNNLLASLPGSPARSTAMQYYEGTSGAPPYWTAQPTNQWLNIRALQSVTVGSINSGNPSDGCNATVCYSYDNYASTGNLMQVKRYDNTQGHTRYVSTSYQYLSNGNVSSITDPNGNITAVTYAGSCGVIYPSQVVVGSGSNAHSTTNYMYYSSDNCVSGLPYTTQDAENMITNTYTYDNLGRQTQVTQAGGISRYTQTAYDDLNLIVTTTQQTDSGTMQAQVLYDALGRVRLSIDPAGNQVLSAYRYGGTMSQVRYQLTSNPYGSTPDGTMGWTLTTLDNMGRAQSVQTFASSSPGTAPPSPWATNASLSGEISTAFNQTVSGCGGPATIVTDNNQPQSNIRTYCPDGLGRFLGLTDPSSNLTSYGYDLLNNLTSVTMGSQSRSFAYNSLSQLISATNPESNTYLYTYDANGNLATSKDPRGTVTTYSTYDALNRPGSKSYAVAGGTMATLEVFYTYDKKAPCSSTGFNGAICSVASGNNTMTFGYDGLGRVAGSTQSFGAAKSYNFSYEFSLTDQLKSVTYPSGRKVTYSFNGADQTTGVMGTPASGPATQYASGIVYTSPGPYSSIALGNGVSESHTWNDRLQHVQIQAGSLMQLNLYPCPGNSNQCFPGNTGSLQSQTINANGTVAIQEYQYDALSRLTLVAERAGSSGFTPSTCSDTGTLWGLGFSYDAAGNRNVSCNFQNSSAASTWGVSTFNSNTNQIQIPTVGYDVNGNLTVAPYAYTMQYDAENRLVAACIPGVGCNNYVYDGLGNRVQKSVLNGPTTTMVYDAFGNLAVDYSTAPAAATGTQYLTADHLGSTRLVMGTQATERHDYEPYGYEIGAPAGTWRTAALGYGVDSGIRQKFAGGEYDFETTLGYFQARYFAAAEGRFISPDPGNAGANQTDPQTWNGYSYVSNNPLTFTDPTGEGLFGDIFGAIGAVAGFLTCGPPCAAAVFKGFMIGEAVGSVVDVARTGDLMQFNPAAISTGLNPSAYGLDPRSLSENSKN